MSFCFIQVVSSVLLVELFCLGSKPVKLSAYKTICDPQFAQEVEFCTLSANIEAYAGKSVKVKAIIGMVIGPTSDGDNLRYSPECKGKKK
jgi:hypothetical protein